jgi:hypothetical protein
LLYFWGISNKSNCFAENDILLGQKSTWPSQQGSLVSYVTPKNDFSDPLTLVTNFPKKQSFWLGLSQVH